MKVRPVVPLLAMLGSSPAWVLVPDTLSQGISLMIHQTLDKEEYVDREAGA